MDLQALGYDSWFSEHATALLQAEQELARVVAVDRGSYVLRTESGEIAGELAGRFRFTLESSADFPCVGDWVCIHRASPERAVVHAVLPRKSWLRRKTAGKTVDFQMIAANIDLAFVIQSCHYDFNLRRLDRYLAACSDGGMETVVLLSKADLLTPDEVDGLVLDVRSSGIPALVIPVSSTTGLGLDRVQALLAFGKTCCFVGSSGVGKSTLINRLLGRDELESKAVSASGEGTHTTSRRQLLLLDQGAMLIDTPGMRELGLLGADEGIDGSFADIRDLALHCRFTSCTHVQEPGCAVLQAIESGELDGERYQRYLKLKRESEHHSRSHVEKRRKDRDFSRHVRSVMKHKKR